MLFPWHISSSHSFIYDRHYFEKVNSDCWYFWFWKGEWRTTGILQANLGQLPKWLQSCWNYQGNLPSSVFHMPFTFSQWAWLENPWQHQFGWSQHTPSLALDRLWLKRKWNEVCLKVYPTTHMIISCWSFQYFIPYWSWWWGWSFFFFFFGGEDKDEVESSY